VTIIPRESFINSSRLRQETGAAIHSRFVNGLGFFHWNWKI